MPLIPKDERFDMPDLLSVLLEKGYRVGAHPTFEPWIDIGRPEDLDFANTHFNRF